MSIKVELPGVHLAEDQYFKDDAGTTWANVLFSKNSDGSINYQSPIDGIDTADGVRKDFTSFSVDLNQTVKPDDYVPGKSTINPATGQVADTPVDSEPLDIAAMNLAFDKQQQSLQTVDNAAEQLTQDKLSRSENSNTVSGENINVDNTGRIQQSNAIRDPLAGQLTDDVGDYLATDRLEDLIRTDNSDDANYLAVDSLESLSKGTNKEEVFDDGWAPNINDGQFGSTVGKATTTKPASSRLDTGKPSPVPAAYLKAINSRPNPLDAFATYNYSISIYLVNKRGLQNLQNGVKSVAGLPLIMQSGGSPEKDMYGAYRSPYFPLDFYIDDVELEGVLSGTGTQHIHNQHTIRFSVTEPYGLTFIDRLHDAVKHYKTSQGIPENKIVYQSQMYLMVIRFNGQSIDGTQHNLASLTNSEAKFTEKFIPFVFTGIRFSMHDDKIVYQCEAAAPMSYYNLNATHSAIPANMELTGVTVGDVLKTGSKYTSLEQLLNQHAQKAAKGTEFANVYKIEFEEGSEIDKKKITPTTSGTNKNRAAMNSSKDNPKPAAADRVDSLKRIKSIQAGTSIVQAIENIVRNSEFVTQQQVVVIDENTGKPRLSDNTANQPFQWFKVVMQTTPRSDKINPETGDHAYEIVYKIKRYQTTPKGDKFFPPPIYRGDHKSYKYWFTGENTQVLNFSQDYNYLYFQQQALRLPGLESPAEINTVNVSRSYYMPRTLEDDTGTENGSGKIAAGVASILYSPGDQAEANIDIVGDPDWIAQSELFYGVDKSHNEPFEEDGSVNINGSQVYFSIEYSAPADYRDNGVMDPVRDEFDRSQPLMRLSYTGISIKSKFSSGEFTQSIRGALNTWTNSEYATRLANGDIRFDMAGYRARIKKNLGIAETKRESATVDWAAEDAFQNQKTITSGTVANQQLEQELLDSGFTEAELAEWNEDTSFTDTKSSTQETIDQFDAQFAADQDGIFAPTETQFFGTNPEGYQQIIDSQNSPTTTTAGDDMLFNSGEFTNPNTSTQNTITNTGGEKTVEQSPLVEPTPVPPAYSGPGYTENESNLTLPTGTTNSGVDSNGQIYGNYKGQEILGGTQGAIDAQKQAIDTGQETTYEDVEYGLTAGDAERVRRKFDPVSGTGEIVGYFNNKTGRWEDAFGNAIK